MVKIAIDIWENLLKLAEDIPTFGVRQLWKKPTLTRQTDLVADLGLIGDDALEFMEKYATAFSVESGDYDYLSYFCPEQLWVLPKFRKTKKKYIITLGMLELAAKTGVWNKEFLEIARSKNNYETISEIEKEWDTKQGAIGVNRITPDG